MPQPREYFGALRRVANLDRVSHLVERHPLEHARQAEAVVSVEMGDADAADLARRHAGELHLALRALARVEQQALGIPPEQIAIVVPAASGHLAGSAENHEFPVGHGTDLTPGRPRDEPQRRAAWQAGKLTVGGRIGLHPAQGGTGDLAGDPGRHPDRKHPVRDAHPRRDRAARRHQRPLPDHRAVEHGRTVANQRLLADQGRMHDAQMANCCSLADLGDRIGSAMQHRPVLHVRAPPDDDRPEVGAQHGPVPDRCFGLDAHVAHERGRRRDPRVSADGRCVAFEGEKRHPPIMPETACTARDRLHGRRPSAPRRHTPSPHPPRRAAAILLQLWLI